MTRQSIQPRQPTQCESPPAEFPYICFFEKVGRSKELLVELLGKTKEVSQSKGCHTLARASNGPGLCQSKFQL